MPEPRRVLAALLAALFLALPATLRAQPAAAPLTPDGAAELVGDVFSLIRDHALAAPPAPGLLAAAVEGVRQTLAAAGRPAAPPSLTGTAADLPTVLDYVRAAAAILQPQPPDALVVQAARGMLREAVDPLAAVFVPAEFAQFVAILRGERGGVGLQVDAVADGIAVVELVGGGPAARGGVLVGDRIADVDGTSTRGRTPDGVMALLAGRIGTAAIVGVLRDGQAMQFTLTRAQVRSVPVRTKLIDPRIGYLRLLEFSDQSAADVGRALTRLLTGTTCPPPERGDACRAGALVLDLRSNGGGLVDESVIIASHFLPAGLVAIEDRRAGPLMLLVRTITPKFTGPLVVLVNGGTASASEIVAGALQDVGVPLIGGPTFGKGTVQTIYSLSAEGSAEWGLRLTTARYRTRAGRPVDGVGLAPDVVLLMSTSQIQSPEDVQLAAALQVLRGRLRTASRGGGR